MTSRGSDDIPTVLALLRPMAETYTRDFIGRHTIFEFNGMAIDVHWGKRHFMHLCGLDCTVPQRMYRHGARPVKSEVFFDAIVSGRMSDLHIRHGHNPGVTRDKMSVLPMMLMMPESVESAAESAGRDYDWFLGCDGWCVGVTLTNEEPVDPDVPPHVPRTVRNVSISSRSIMRIGATLYPVTGYRVIPPRT